MKTIYTILICMSAISGYGQLAKLTFSGNTNDVSGNGNNATNYGATLTTDRFNKANSAYQFDGSNDYMTLASTFDHVNRTFKIWIYVDNLNSTAQSAIVSDNPSLNNGLTGAIILSTNMLQTIAGNNTVENTVSADKWYMVTITSRSDSFFCYLDSNLVGARINNKYKSGAGMAKTVIGSSRNTTNQFWGGKLDDIGIWDQYMTAAQVKAMYKQESQNSTDLSGVSGQTPLQVYPNPFNQVLTFELPYSSDVKITSMSGQLVYSLPAQIGLQEINTGQFAPGIYLLQVCSPFNVYSSMIIKE